MQNAVDPLHIEYNKEYQIMQQKKKRNKSTRQGKNIDNSFCLPF